MVPDVFHPLIKYHSRKVDYAMTPGVNQLTWTSLNVGSFLEKVEAAIAQFERLTKQVRKVVQQYILQSCIFTGYGLA